MTEHIQYCVYPPCPCWLIAVPDCYFSLSMKGGCIWRMLEFKHIRNFLSVLRFVLFFSTEHFDFLNWHVQVL